MAIATGPDHLPIAAVERTTGIARATLRIWERRYGFPQPQRDPRGERSYAPEQVEKLRLIATLMARGHRPGRLVGLTAGELLARMDAVASWRPPAGAPAAGDPALALLRGHDVAGLLAHLEDLLASQGPAAFSALHLPRLRSRLRDACVRGEVEVYEQQLLTECLNQVLRSALARLPAPSAVTRPRVLLATFPGEPQAVGLLAAQVVLAASGCACVSLGVCVPLPQIVLAASALEVDVVGIAFTGAMNPAHALRALERLRAGLPAGVALWAGGDASVPVRRRIDGVVPVRDLAELPEWVGRWQVEPGEGTASAGP